MTIKQLYSKLFIGGKWHVGYRTLNAETPYEIVETPQKTWIADPFLFEHKGEHYLFVEIYDELAEKAGIGYYHFENGVPKYKGVIISNPYHMSYPCVFVYKDNIYMIPETSGNNTI